MLRSNCIHRGIHGYSSMAPEVRQRALVGCDRVLLAFMNANPDLVCKQTTISQFTNR
jgi:hypothetical protein